MLFVHGADPMHNAFTGEEPSLMEDEDPGVCPGFEASLEKGEPIRGFDGLLALLRAMPPPYAERPPCLHVEHCAADGIIQDWVLDSKTFGIPAHWIRCGGERSNSTQGQGHPTLLGSCSARAADRHAPQHLDLC